MKIVHISPDAPYNEGWGYQENYLPKHQMKLGHEVTLITTVYVHENGIRVKTDSGSFLSLDGFNVIRVPHSHRGKIGSFLSRMRIYRHLQEIQPDFIFFHGLTSTTIFDAIKYKKRINKRCVIVQDNHSDYNIGFDIRKKIGFHRNIERLFYICVNKLTIKYVDRVYGVTPWRKEYAEKVYKISNEKTDVLIMGADDESMDFDHRKEICHRIRNSYGVDSKDFLIVTGGKIDSKKRVDVLMKACSCLPEIKLLVFGEVKDDIKKDFEDLLQKSSNIIYVGWIGADKVYDYFFAADLIVFPGQHSVLWEQACASKTPCLFKRWEGMEHVDNGGNSAFLDDVSPNGMRKAIEELRFTEKYYRMKNIAESDKTDIYLYSNIAKKSLECASNNPNEGQTKTTNESTDPRI